MVEPSSLQSVVDRGASRLASASRDPRKDAVLLLSRLLERDHAWLLAHPDSQLMPEQIARYEELLARRARHEPIQYILGEQEFYGLPLRVTPAVLIPRPETEHLIEAVLARLPRDRPLRIADVGTGSGAIALALVSELPLARVDALDVSREALAVAEGNARALGLAERVRFLHSDLLAAVQSESYDCIVSNPPYVSSLDVLEPQVVLWEPHTALFAGPDGLAVYRALLPQSAAHMQPGGLLAVELGAGHEAALAALFAEDPCWAAPIFLADLQGIVRIACATRQ